MHLELIQAAGRGQKKPVKLLFVHGICAGAWVWEQSFLPFFASFGYDSYALSLRGHGVIVKNGAHAVMMDRNWQDAARPVADWLAKTFAGGRGL